MVLDAGSSLGKWTGDYYFLEVHRGQTLVVNLWPTIERMPSECVPFGMISLANPDPRAAQTRIVFVRMRLSCFQSWDGWHT